MSILRQTKRVENHLVNTVFGQAMLLRKMQYKVYRRSLANKRHKQQSKRISQSLTFAVRKDSVFALSVHTFTTELIIEVLNRLFVKSDRACDDKTRTFVVTDYVNNHLALCDFKLLLICLTDVCTCCRPTFLHPSLLSLVHRVLSNHIMINYTQITILDKTFHKLSSTHIIPRHTFQMTKTFLAPPPPRHEKMLNCTLVFSVPQRPTFLQAGLGQGKSAHISCCFDQNIL